MTQAPNRMQFFVVEEIGPNRSLTPSGFLLCTDVPLARTGIMNYAPGETPVAVGPMGYVQIERNADEVFSPQSLASYSGAPFVVYDDGGRLEHPEDDVIPTNWRDLSDGVVLNARRGDGELSECVVGDILVTTPRGIEAIQGGKREVSVGYTCSYDQIEPGRGRQRDIVVNHVALVERGRCGPRCAIGDNAPKEIPVMTAKTNDSSIIKRALTRLRASIATRDEEAIEKDLTGLEAVSDLAAGDPAAGAPAPGTNVHIHLSDEFPKKDDDKKDEKKDDKKTEDEENPLEARVAALESGVGEIKTMLQKMAGGEQTAEVNDEKILGALQEEAPPGTSDAAIKSSTKDSAILAHSFRDTVSLAEVLAPGLPPPSFDAKLPAAKTFDSICGHRRAALKVAATSPQLVKFISEGLPRGKTIDSMSCDETRTLFKASAAVKAALNNGTGKTADAKLPGAGAAVNSKVTSIAELNKLGKEKYGATH